MTEPIPESTAVIEVCAGSLDVAIAADEAGADRIELNAALELDGLTPSWGLVHEVLQAIRIPVIAMARPRDGDFCYSESEWKVLCRDVEQLLEMGVAGIAFGCVQSDGLLDVERTAQIRRLVPGSELVFHRAFDEGKDPDRLEKLIDCGIDRIMTSGGESDAWSGRKAIAEYVEAASGRIGIIPAAGIDLGNARELLEVAKCGQIHGTYGTRKLQNRGEMVQKIRQIVSVARNGDQKQVKT